jgi:hypothetical protein
LGAYKIVHRSPWDEPNLTDVTAQNDLKSNIQVSVFGSRKELLRQTGAKISPFVTAQLASRRTAARVTNEHRLT